MNSNFELKFKMFSVCEEFQMNSVAKDLSKTFPEIIPSSELT